MKKNELHTLYSNHRGKSSDKWSLYLNVYNRFLSEFRKSPIRLLEIGVQNGGSLEIWSNYFDRFQTLVGCDINPDCAKLSYSNEHINVVIGDSSDISTYKTVTDICSEFEIVIDDGSHISKDIIKSFCLYFPHISEGGIYIAEDLHCSYWPDFEGGLFETLSSISFFKKLADIINYEHWGLSSITRTTLIAEFLEQYNCKVSEHELEKIHSVEFINSMCIIRKDKPQHNLLGIRIVAGTEENVVQGNISLHDTDSNINIKRGELSSEKSSDEDDRLSSLTRALEINIFELQEEISHLNDQLDLIKASKSWRGTAPLRYITQKLRHWTS